MKINKLNRNKIDVTVLNPNFVTQATSILKTAGKIINEEKKEISQHKKEIELK